MINLRPFAKLGGADHGWLKARHHFSFADYRDPMRMNWGHLRVWNDDEIAPGTGFDPHPHANMEIVTYVRQGAISHEDSMGNAGRTEAGDVQVISAGSGIRHAEYNHEAGVTMLFQIWILPDAHGGAPSWGTKPFPKHDRAGRLVALASGFSEDVEALPIRARARVLGATIRKGESVTYRPPSNAYVYLVPAVGTAAVGGVRVGARDGAAIHDEETLVIEALDDAEMVLVETE